MGLIVRIFEGSRTIARRERNFSNRVEKNLRNGRRNERKEGETERDKKNGEERRKLPPDGKFGKYVKRTTRDREIAIVCSHSGSRGSRRLSIFYDEPQTRRESSGEFSKWYVRNLCCNRCLEFFRSLCTSHVDFLSLRNLENKRRDFHPTSELERRFLLILLILLLFFFLISLGEKKITLFLFSFVLNLESFIS